MSYPEYTFHNRFLHWRGSWMHYLDEGKGRPVLMVHGNPTWSFYYRNLVGSLRDGHRCVVPDHIGCGLSDKPGDDAYTYTLSRRVDDLERLVEHLGLDELDLVVHDWGGMIGFAWAVRHPDKVRRIVVLNTAAFHNPKGQKLPFGLWLGRDTALGALLIRGLNAFSGWATRLAVKKPMSKELRDAYTAPYRSWGDRIATLRFVQDIPLGPEDPAWGVVTETEQQLERLKGKPMLVCWGERDFVFDGPFLAEWERRFPDAEVHRFPDAGHYVLEDAADAILPLVGKFLK